MYDLAFYGTLRDPDILRQVAGASILKAYVGNVWLSDWGCYFVEGERFPVAIPEVGSSLELSLYHSVSETCWKHLLAYEDVDYAWGEWLIAGRVYRYFVGEQTLNVSRRIWTLHQFQRDHKAAFYREMGWDSRSLPPEV